MKRFLASLALTSLVGLTTGCDFFESLTKTTQAVSIVTRTPELSEANGMDPDLLTALTAGGLFDQISDGTTAVFVGIGEREDPWSVQAPDPVADADVLLSWAGNQIAVCAATSGKPGTYLASSVAEADCGDATLAYVEGATYLTEIAFADVSGSLEVEAPTAVAQGNVAFSPALSGPDDHYGASLLTHGGGALTVDWSADSAASQRPAILTVFYVAFNGSTANDALNASSWTVGDNPVHTDMPDSPADMIDIILLDTPPTSAEIPASVFSSRGLYFVVLTSAELSETKEQLGIGSGALAGVGTAWVFWVD